jgi:predicted ATPase
MKLEQPFMLALLAETYERAGQASLAQQAVEEAIGLAQASGEDYWRPELYRLRGHFQLLDNHVELAQESFQQALSLARSQEAKSLELRAAIELSQMWEQQGRCAEAFHLLHPIYAWFTEGLETADLRQARELLKALAP